MSIATLSDIEFVTRLEAAAEMTDEAVNEWPSPASPAQALALADFYGSDGESGTAYEESEMDALIVAVCVLAKAYREATL